MTSLNRLSLSLIVVSKSVQDEENSYSANIHVENSDKLKELSHVKSVLYIETHLVYKVV